MDGSQVGRGCMVLMVGVVYKKRTLPIAWLVYEGQKGHTTAERHIEVLEKVKALLPKDAKVLLLGDAEYDTTEMLIWLQEKTKWNYVLRTSPQIYMSPGVITSYSIHYTKLYELPRICVFEAGVDSTRDLCVGGGSGAGGSFVESVS